MNHTALIRLIIGGIGDVFALALFVSPWLTIKDVRKNKAVVELSSLPYLGTLLISALGMAYGLVHPKEHVAVIVVNGVGILAESAYLGVYIRYCPDKNDQIKLGVAWVLEVVFAAVFGAVMIFCVHPVKLVTIVLGTCYVAGNFLMAIAPIKMMIAAVRNHSVKDLPFLPALASTLYGAWWIGYSFIGKDDYFVLASSLCTSASRFCQLILYAKFYTPSQGNPG